MTANRTGGPDPLEKLLLLAGRRKPADPKRTDQIEQLTHERWQAMLARRHAAQRRRRFQVFGGSIAAAASIVGAVMLVSQLMIEAPMVASVVSVFGAAETGARGHAMTTLHANDQLHAGSVLETDHNGGVNLQLTSGHSLRLAAATRVRIEADSVVLDAGALYLDSGEDQQATPIEVRSHLATVTELGTQYMATLNGNSLQVSVREGAVRVSQGNTVALATAGEMLHLDEFGNTEKLAVPRYGEHWTWVAQLARVPALDDLTLAEFLHWLVREHGWQLEFANPELAQDASTVALYGSIDGMSGEDALAAVMMATQWRYRLTDGLLTVESRGDNRR